MKITRELYGKTLDGKEASIFTLSNQNGVIVRITDFGATIISILVPDKNGYFDDVVLGFDNLEDYFVNTPYFGCIVGRNINRIEKGVFELNGKTYQLAINNGENHIHGGLSGFNKALWEARVISSENEESLQFTYLSKDGEEGYPGNLNVKVTYKLLQDNSLIIGYYAISDKDTVVNLTNHAYFNLKRHDAGNILNHQVMINADQFTATNSQGITTGDIINVENSPLDFKTLKTIGDGIDSANEQIVAGRGYDHNWILNTQVNTSKKNIGNIAIKAAEVLEPESGRILEVYTTKPGLQFYTGNFLDGTFVGKNQTAYAKRSGFCLETQYFPNSMKHTHFPSPILRAGEEYKHQTIYKFLVSGL